MLTVACVYWKGTFRGRENVYSEEWVDRLEHMVFKNLPEPHRFVCLSNVDVPCERIPLINDWPGWWSKIELFRSGLFKGRVLYLDLDLVVIDDLYPFIEFPSKFGIIKSHGKGNSSEDGKKIKKAYNSSVMVFDAGAGDSLYAEFNNTKIIKTFRGDQDYIAHKFPGLDTFPKDWVRKLGSLPEGKPKPSTKIVLCMAGKEMPKKNVCAAERYEWVNKIWQ